MRETPRDLAALQSVIDSSAEKAGPFLRSSFRIPEHTMSAAQLAEHLTGMRTIALATVTPQGAPRVAPIAALFVKGRFYIPTVAEAARTRQVSLNPAISLTYYEADELAIIVHGRAEILANGEDFDELERLHRELNGSSVNDWGEGVFLRIQPSRMYSFVRDPGDMD